MMTPIGKPLLWLAMLLLCQTAGIARAAVEATVDRQQVAMGDTLQLVVSANDDDEDLGSVQLAELQRDWEVLSRNTRSNTTIMNGQRTHNRQLQMEISPRKTGQLTIPSFRVGAKTTRPIAVTVTDAPTLDHGSQTVLFEASVDRDSVYVQGQLLLTLRLQQAVNLDGRSISDLQLPGAFVVPLEQKSFQRRVNGRPWLVHEVRYAIFPEQSGTLEIPAQSFSARESTPRRSIFDNARGRLIRLQSEPLQIEVLSRPTAFPGGTWLPARNIVIEEEWSADPEALRAGESITRTVRLRGEGLQGAQLPPVRLPPTPGIKQYPDQPAIDDAEISTGLLGSRTDSVAVVATQAGSIELPAFEIPWWDTEAEVMRTAVVPSRTLKVAVAAPTDIALPPMQGQLAAPTVTKGTAQSPLLWQFIALLCALGWAITLYLLLRKRPESVPDDQKQPGMPSVRAAYKSLLAACVADQANQARKQLIQWIAATREDPAITSLEMAARAVDDTELSAQVALLEKALYGQAPGQWQGTALKSVVERLHKRSSRPHGDDAASLSLYPA